MCGSSIRPSGYDGPGGLIVTEGVIADVVKGGDLGSLSPDLEVIDGKGAMLLPGLVDIRVKTGEPGTETKETLKSAALARRRGGVTSIVLQPDTDPVIDEPSVVDFILRRARDIELVKVHVAGAATKGALGERMAEIGLMAERGLPLHLRRRPAHRRFKGAAPRPGLRQGLRRAGGAPAGGPVALRRRGGSEGEFALADGPCPACRPSPRDHAGAGPGAGGAHRRAAAGRPAHHRRRPESFQRGRDKGLPVTATHLDQPPVVQRDRHRRLPDLLQGRSAAQERGRPPGDDRGRGPRA